MVLSNNDGCVISRSNEAKALEIPMGAAAFKYKNQFKKYNVKVFSSNYALYGDMSRRVMSILEQFSPDVEVYSIDEAFLKLTSFNNLDITEESYKIKKQIYQWTGIPVSIGLAPSKSLAKIANKIAKKFNHQISWTNGLVALILGSNENIEDVWGVSNAKGPRLPLVLKML